MSTLTVEKVKAAAQPHEPSPTSLKDHKDGGVRKPSGTYGREADLLLYSVRRLCGEPTRSAAGEIEARRGSNTGEAPLSGRTWDQPVVRTQQHALPHSIHSGITNLP